MVRRAKSGKIMIKIVNISNHFRKYWILYTMMINSSHLLSIYHVLCSVLGALHVLTNCITFDKL